MPSPIMLTEAAFLIGPGFAAPRVRRCRTDRQFETWAKMEGVDIHQLEFGGVARSGGEMRPLRVPQGVPALVAHRSLPVWG